MDGPRLFSGSSNPVLTKRIADYLEQRLGECTTGRFSDGEISFKYNENIRGTDVFIIQSTHPPAENLMELLIMIDAARRASAKRITAVIPYFGYARQDRKDQPRVAITAKLVANLITTAGAHRVLTMDLHCAQIQGFFDIPFDHIYASTAFLDEELRTPQANRVVVAPDVGSVKMARAYAKRLDASLAILDKRRPKANQVEVTNVIGEVKGKKILMIDDMVDTGRTLINAARVLKEKGAESIQVFCTHPVLSGDAIERFSQSEIDTMTVTDTLYLSEEALAKNSMIEVMSVAHLFGEAIQRIHMERSISKLFDWQTIL